MTYNLDWLKSEFEHGNAGKFLCFWGHRPSRNGEITGSCLSQWWHAPFIVEGVEYKTAEHWMMAQKARLFGSDSIYNQIITCNSPGEAKALGRQVDDFDQKVWDQARFQIIVEGNLHKFGQHKDLQTFLLGTQGRILVEASPVDPVWGIGLAADDPRAQNPFEWQGLNLLGFALMETRDILGSK